MMENFQVVCFSSSNPPIGATIYSDFVNQILFDSDNIQNLPKPVVFLHYRRFLDKFWKSFFY